MTGPEADGWETVYATEQEAFYGEPRCRLCGDGCVNKLCGASCPCWRVAVSLDSMKHNPVVEGPR